MPALVVLGVVGVIAVIWPAFARSRGVAYLRAPLLGSAAALVPVITIGYVANRYLGDFVPLLAIAGLAGLHTLLRRREEPSHRRSANGFLVVAAVLAVFGVWVNTSLALEYQRLADPLTLQQRTEAVRLQYGVDRRLGGRPRDVSFLPDLPERAGPAFTSAVVGSCDAMYWSDGQAWWEIEGQPAAGVVALRVTFPRRLGDAWQPLLVTGNGDLAVGVKGAGDTVQFGLGLIGTDHALHWVPGLGATPARSTGVDVDIVVSRPRRDITVVMGGENVLDIPIPTTPPIAPYRLGTAHTAGIADRFAGAVTPRQPDLGLCRELLRRSGAG
jgi:hypothetical protein